MSIIKHPITLALIATALVFTVTYYYFNNYTKSSDDKNDKTDKSDKKKSKSKKNKDEKKIKDNVGVNETIVILSAIAGLITWYIATNYFSDKADSDKNINLQNGSNNNSAISGTSGINNPTDPTELSQVNQIPKNEFSGGPGSKTGNNVLKGGSVSTNTNMNAGSNLNKVPRINSDDPTRSYNLIGSGLDIPRSELKIPNVLIDYH
jgi:hypothetical protein